MPYLLRKSTAIIVMSMIWVCPTLAQNLPPIDVEVAYPSYGFLMQREFISAVLVLVFGVFVSIFSIFALRAENVTAEQVIRLVSLIMIVSGTLFLVAAGYDSSQIAPALGLLGSLAGYLLGRSDRKKSKDQEEE